MPKEQANYRIDTEAKDKAYAVLRQIGIKPTDAVNMLMHHIAMFGEFPFKLSIPNAETLHVFKDTEAGRGLTRHTTVDDIFDHMDD